MAICGPLPGAQEQTGRGATWHHISATYERGDPGESLELVVLIFSPVAVPASEAGRRRESPAAVNTKRMFSGRLPVGIPLPAGAASGSVAPRPATWASLGAC